MERLSDTLLLETYKKSIALELSPDFIQIIKEELDRRSITFED